MVINRENGILRKQLTYPAKEKIIHGSLSNFYFLLNDWNFSIIDIKNQRIILTFYARKLN